MEATYVVYFICALSIVLGFIALLTQKVYIDNKTNEPIDIEIPLLGKFRTNYPAAIFVILGFSLAAFTFNKSYPPPKVEWTITGSFQKPDNAKVDWEHGSIELTPSPVQDGISNLGKFTIKVKIDEGKSIEDIFERLAFTWDSASVDCNLVNEYKNYKNNDESLIHDATKRTLNFKPIPVTIYGK